mgnify:CR=1 FL=1
MYKDNSFSSEVRSEITHSRPKICCRRYILAAFMEAARTYQVYDGPVLRFNSLDVAGFAIKILRSFDLEFLWTRSASPSVGGDGQDGPANVGEKCHYIIKLMEEPKLGKTRRCLQFLREDLLNLPNTERDLRFWVSPAGQAKSDLGVDDNGKNESVPVGGKTLTLNLCCRRHWLSGLFLAFGSISDPHKEYCLELALPSRALAERASVCLRLDGVKPSLSKRRRTWVVTLKRALDIAETLSIMGANSARLNFEEVLALKETRNDVRRRVNAESANMARSSLASVRQIGCLRLLQREGVLVSLPSDLQSIALARLDNPEASLRELGAMFEPNIPRTTLSRKLSKLEALSKKLGEPNSEDFEII